MKLYVSDTSPYSRKVRVLILEKGLGDRVEILVQNPFEESAELVDANPLKKVPAFLCGNGAAIFDSPIICAYIDSIDSDQKLIPDGDSKWSILTRAAMADGILDAAFAIVMERRRPDQQQSEMWLERWQAAISRTLDLLEGDTSAFIEGVSLAEIALGCALGYLDFRLPDIGWRASRPNLTSWFDEFQKRPSMQATVP